MRWLKWAVLLTHGVLPTVAVRVHACCREEKELKRKEKVLAELDGLFQEWVRSCGRDVNIEDVHGKPVRGRLETSGAFVCPMAASLFFFSGLALSLSPFAFTARTRFLSSPPSRSVFRSQARGG